jgi:hypothetical protein
LSPTKLARVAHSIATARERVITNNYFSSDWAAWTPGTAITRIEPPALDNDLAWRLNRQAGLDVAVWPKSAATLFDIDTPTDLMILSRSPQLSPRLGAYLQRLPLETARVDALAQLLNDPRAELVVAGRVSAFTIQQLEQNSPAQFRVFSEERGMRASGRLARGAVRSLLGMLYESVGPQRFFERLAELGQGAILDTRVLLAHGGRQVATPDRFYCDTLEAEKIVDAFAREFTLAARESGLPLLLGGHSLVSGGLAALLELYKRAA